MFPTQKITSSPTERTCSDESEIAPFFEPGNYQTTKGSSETFFESFDSDSCSAGGDVVILAAQSSGDCPPVCIGIVVNADYQCSCFDLDQWSLISFDDLSSFGTLYYGYPGAELDVSSCRGDLIFANC